MTDRAANLRQRLPGFEAAVVKTPENRFYLLDFDSHDAGTLLVFPDEMVFIIDSRYIEVARREVKNATVVLETDALAQAKAELVKRGVKTCLVENGITVAGLDALQKAFEGVKLDASAALSSAIMAMRQIKDDDEIARMREAQRITDACFGHILPFIQAGVREIDIMLEMERYMRANDAEKVAFDTIAVAGANSSLPHGVPGEYALQPGDFLTLDFGAKYKGYCADMTRTVALGHVCDAQQKVYDTVLKAHLAGIAAARAGTRGNEVDKVARDIIYTAGYEGCFGHGLGHAVGIEVHESPRYSPLCKDEILAGMMMTVEPGVYLAGQFGCRIEDTVLITATGCEPLPTSPKELIIL